MSTEEGKRETLAWRNTGMVTPAARTAERRRRRRERRRAARRRQTEAATAAAVKAPSEEAAPVIIMPTRPTPEEVRERQGKDPKVKALIDYLEGKVPNVNLLEMRRMTAQAERLALRDGVLGHINPPNTKRPVSEFTWTEVVPDVEGARRSWFDKAHAQEGGHMAHGATYARLIQMVNWDTIWADCMKWSKECLVCDLFRKPELDHGLLQPTTKASLKGQRSCNVD